MDEYMPSVQDKAALAELYQAKKGVGKLLTEYRIRHGRKPGEGNSAPKPDEVSPELERAILESKKMLEELKTRNAERENRLRK